MPREEGLTFAFVDLADTLVRDFDVIGCQHNLTEHCVDLLGVTAAGVLLVIPQGQVVEAAASDERTRMLELASVEWDEGPCRDCCHSRAPISDVSLDTEAAKVRRPRFAPRAVQLGFTSVVAAPLRRQNQVIGALNLFRDQPGPPDGTQLRLAQALADTATIGILQRGGARTDDRDRATPVRAEIRDRHRTGQGIPRQLPPHQRRRGVRPPAHPRPYPRGRRSPMRPATCRRALPKPLGSILEFLPGPESGTGGIRRVTPMSHPAMASLLRALDAHDSPGLPSLPLQDACQELELDGLAFLLAPAAHPANSYRSSANEPPPWRICS